MKEQGSHLSLKIWWEIKQWRAFRSSTQNLKLDSNKCEEPGACYSKTRSKSCGESVLFVLSILSCTMSPPHPKKHRGCEMHLHHWHSRVVFCHLRKTESVCQLLEETSIYPSDLCLVTGEGAGLEARQSSCYRSIWQQSGWVIYMFNHSKSAENYLAEFRWSNNVSVCIAQHFPFIPFLTI